MEESLVSFCEEQTKGRDSSHGVDHMKKVYHNAKIIMANENLSEESKNMIMAVALFHDISDHKYYHGDELTAVKERMKECLLKFFDETKVTTILFIIENVSFSKEKNKQIHWEEFDKNTHFIRNIVSDYDKLEAI